MKLATKGRNDWKTLRKVKSGKQILHVWPSKKSRLTENSVKKTRHVTIVPKHYYWKFEDNTKSFQWHYTNQSLFS